MARQYDRYCKVTLEGAGTLDVSMMRCRFQVTHYESQTPANAEVYIYNLARSTEQKIEKEYSSITIEAGYQEQYGIIFKGEIIQKRTGRENPVDTYINIIARSADQGNGYAVVNKTLQKGHTKNDMLQEILKSFQQYGISAGYISEKIKSDQTKSPRGAALFGMARERLRELCQGSDCVFSLRNQQVQILGNAETVPGGTIVLNSQTGMIGRAEQTIEGVVVKSLLNPAIHNGVLIQINERSINKAAFSVRPGDEGVNQILADNIATDGMYKALFVDHYGDTRGVPWYSETTCIRADGKGVVSPRTAQRGVVLPDGTGGGP